MCDPRGVSLFSSYLLAAMFCDTHTTVHTLDLANALHPSALEAWLCDLSSLPHGLALFFTMITSRRGTCTLTCSRLCPSPKP